MKRQHMIWITITAIVIGILLAGCSSTTTKTNQSTPAAATTAPAPTANKIGTPVKSGDLVITVASATRSPGDEISTPTAGNEYIVLDIDIANQGAKPSATISTVMEMAIRDQAGHKYDQAMFFPEPKFPDGDAVAPGGKARGLVAFEVPAGAADLDFTFTEAFGDPVVIKLQ